ncbi:hypothetical protein [Nitritalea halalkaliphila]|uniref:hypothetical protein n=1 Tax=Nitritalea halalkaliphila TaxID=590849 RepID=UPI000303065C|nr:hypothetical protein [Nitritalea halalkaliphila]
MKKKYLSLLAGMGLLLGSSELTMAQGDYPTLSQIDQRVKQIGNSSVASVKSLTKTAGGKDIWAIQIGTGDRDNKPALAIVGGIEAFMC